jgi:hypothetical protein
MDFFPAAERALVCLLMEYFSVYEIDSNPDENPGLPMAFENINEKYPSTKNLTFLSNVCLSWSAGCLFLY